MQDRPTAAELLVAVGEFLEEEVMPQSGRVGYHARVARNVVEVVRRELEQGAAADAAERVRLVRLLDDASGADHAAHPETRDGLDLHADNAQLAHRIRDRSLDARRDEVLAHLRATSATKLAIANPRELALWSSPPDT